MHKNIPAADIDINETSGNITKIRGVQAAEHLPPGVHCKKGVVNRAELNEWWGDRSVPPSRPGIREVLDIPDIQTPKALPLRCFGLSLSDGYWVRPAGSDLAWSKINFFENPFSEDMGNMLLGDFADNTAPDLCSPDNTTDGCLKKRWKIIGGKRCLLKGGEPPYYQQPFNEVIASRIMDKLQIPHAEYTLLWQGEMPYSVCEDMVTPETELVSAWRVCSLRRKANHESYYGHYIALCKELGIDSIEHSLDMMIVLDFIIANEDRHFNNFGLIRNADTLQWTGAAPIFDSGTSLAYNRPTRELFNIACCKPFKKTHTAQLKLVTSFDWIDFSKLREIPHEIREIMSTEKAKALLGERRHEDISRFVKRKITELERFAIFAGSK